MKYTLITLSFCLATQVYIIFDKINKFLFMQTILLVINLVLGILFSIYFVHNFIIRKTGWIRLAESIEEMKKSIRKRNKIKDIKSE